MTAEKLHDAIGLLPADLVAETDKRRHGKPKVIRWKRYAAMAACFVLVASCTWFASLVLTPRGAAESMKQTAAPAAAAPMEPAAAPEEAASNGVSGSSDATAEDLLPAADMEQVREESAQEAGGLVSHAMQTPLKPTTACFGSESQVTLVTSREDLDAYLTDKDWIYDFTEVREVCTAFDGAWFEERDLLLIAKLCLPVGSDCSISSVTEENGTWYVGISYDLLPESVETTEWHILLELEKSQIPDAEAVVLIYE